MARRSQDVFVNCAFDAEFKPVFYAIVFAIIRSGFNPRCAMETDDASVNRFSKIESIVEQCRFSIHDISRTQSDGSPPLPRFNMPLELGLFLGAKRYGDAVQKRKRVLILDTERYRYQKFISDIAGQDIHAHGSDPGRAIEEVATWLRDQTRTSGIPGGRKIAEEFEAFQMALPAILSDRSLHPDEITFGDFTSIATIYIEAAQFTPANRSSKA